MHGWSGSLINVPYGAYLDHCYAWNLQTHFLGVFVVNLKNDAIYGFYPESFCDKNLAIRKVFAFSASARASWWVAARWLWRVLARGPRRRWRHPVGEEVEDDSVGGIEVVAISSFNLVLPPTVATDNVACPPAFSSLHELTLSVN